MALAPTDHDRADLRALLALGVSTVIALVVDAVSVFTRTEIGTRLTPEWVAAVRYLYHPLVGAGIPTGAARAISLGAVFVQAFIVVYAVAEVIAWMRRRVRGARG